MERKEDILGLIRSHSEMFEDAFAVRNTTDEEILYAERELGFLGSVRTHLSVCNKVKLQLHY